MPQPCCAAGALPVHPLVGSEITSVTYARCAEGNGRGDVTVDSHWRPHSTPSSLSRDRTLGGSPVPSRPPASAASASAPAHGLPLLPTSPPREEPHAWRRAQRDATCVGDEQPPEQHHRAADGRWFQMISGDGVQNNCFIDSFLLCVGTDDTLRPLQVDEIAAKLHSEGLRLTGTMTDFNTLAPLMVVDQIGGLLNCCYRVYIHYYNVLNVSSV